MIDLLVRLALPCAFLVGGTNAVHAQVAADARPGATADQQAALQAAQRFLATLSSKDKDGYAASTVPEGRGTGTEITVDGRHTVFSYTFEELVEFLPTAVPDKAVERLVDPMVRVDGDIAMVWGDYVFTVDGELSHCGTDHFDLLRKDGVWRVFNLTWTTRRDDCAGLLVPPASVQEGALGKTGGDDRIAYATGDPDDWPDRLEAVVAAPDNHKVLLENERVRVLEVTLAPGEAEPLHFHRWPSVLHITQAGEWIDRDAEGAVIFDSREVPPMTFPLTMWKGPEAPHSPVNLSEDIEVRLIRVEIKPNAANMTGVILSPDDGLVNVSNPGDALVRLENGEADLSDANGGAQDALQGAIANWVNIYNRNDWALLAEQFTQDAVMMPPNAPAVVGRGAIAAWEAANEEGFRIALSPDEIFLSGDRAIIQGRSCVFIPLADGSTGVDVGKFLEVRRRQTDGRWLISHDVFNSDLSAGSELADTCPNEAAKSIILREGATDASVRDGVSDLMPILDSRTRVILEGIRSGDVSGIMALYGPGSLYSADNATLLSKPETIETFWANVAASPAHDATLEALRIERLGPDAFVEIQKYDVFDAAGGRLFGGYAMLLWRREGGRWLIAGDVSN